MLSGSWPPAALLLLILSPFAGSFLALLADRLPRGEAVVIARSACRGCGRRLAARDLLPILSFALARGRCRSCGSVIPAWLLYSEILATGLALLAILATPDALTAWAHALFLWLLLALGLCDLTRFRLPDPLTAALLLVALWLALLPAGAGLGMALLGAGAGAGGFWLIRAGYHALRGREGMGLGDVKLMAGLGAYAGPLDLPLLVLVAALGGLGAALLTLGLRPDGRDTRLGQRAVPFGVALCAAAAALWLARMADLLPV